MTRLAQVPRQVLEKFILGFEGHELPDDLRELLAAGLGGVIIFPRNFSSVEKLRSLTAEIRQAAGELVFIGIDQEGGTQFSLPEPFTLWVSPEELGKLDDEQIVEKQAGALARELRAVGCNLNFAPMLDLHLQSESPVTKGRSFGSNPQKVAQLGIAFARGLAREGVLACAKHFPGHGDVTVDPHQDLPVFCGDAARLRTTEMVPFAALASANVPMIMTAHILLPEIEPTWPASLSSKILGDLRAIGYSGVILADDLGMGAITKQWPTEEAAIQTFRAGSDMALLCHDWKLVQRALEGTAAAYAAGKFDDREWNASRERIASLRKSMEISSEEMPSLSIVGCTEHRAIVQEVREQQRKMLS